MPELSFASFSFSKENGGSKTCALRWKERYASVYRCNNNARVFFCLLFFFKRKVGQKPCFFPNRRHNILRTKSKTNTDRDKRRAKPSSSANRGAVRKTLPPRYTKVICTTDMRSIIAINTRFRPMPENSFSLSVRALKQLNTEVNIKSAKNALSNVALSLDVLNFEVIAGQSKNAIKSPTVNIPDRAI